MAKSIEEKLRDRATLINQLYDDSDGSTKFYDSVYEVGKRAGLDQQATDSAAEYLIGKGLAKWAAMGSQIEITHYGIEEVEQSRSAPDRETEHLPAHAVVFGNIHNSQIQMGTSHSVQIQGSPEELVSQVRALVSTFRDNLEGLGLSEAQRMEAEAELATLDAQAGSPKPKREIIQASMNALRDITISLGSSVAVQAIMSQFGMFGR